MNCPDCFSSNLREVHADGDLVCMGCGLVVQSHMIDTTPIVNVYDLNHFTLYETGQCQKEFVYVGVSLDIPDNTVILADELFKNQPSTKGTNRKATMARAFLKACQETKVVRPRHVIFDLFGINEQEFVQAKTSQTCMQTTFNLQSRFASHAQDLIGDVKQRCQVLKYAVELDEKLKNNTHYSNTKQSKMDGVVFFYAAQALNISINKKQVIHICQMSNVTFNKHIKFLTGLQP